MNQNVLLHTAKFLVASPRGVLSIPSGQAARDALAAAHVHGADANRMRLAELLVGMHGVEASISGVLVGPDTLTHLSDELAVGRFQHAFLRMILGVDLFDTDHHLGDIQGRLRRWFSVGARFANWTLHLPSRASTGVIQDRCEEAACFAKACELEGIVPMLLIAFEEGEDEDGAMDEVLEELFSACSCQSVYFPGLLLRVPAPADAAPVPGNFHTGIPDRLGGMLIDQGDLPTSAFRAVMESVLTGSPVPWPVSFILSRAFARELVVDWHGSMTLEDYAGARARDRMEFVRDALDCHALAGDFVGD